MPLTTSESSQLSELYAKLENWISLDELDGALGAYFHGKRSVTELADYRARRGSSKKLCDEIVPISNYLKFTQATGHVKFSIGDDFPDCWWRASLSSRPRGIEATVAQARERHLLGKELNEKGIGRGFLGLADNAPSDVFKKRLAHPRTMYSTDQALQVIGDGIKSCLRKKENHQHADCILVIDAPLRSLPRERWSTIQKELRVAAESVPFREVCVVGPNAWGFRIK